MEMPLPAGVIFVDNVTKVAVFYQGVASMALAHADERHAVLSTPWFQLTVHALPPSQEALGTYPAREDRYIKLCFPVADLYHARAQTAHLGGELQSKANE